MSEYMRLKTEIEAMQAKLERVRAAELEAEVIDMRKRIIAWGILPEQLFPDLHAYAGPLRKPRVRPSEAGGQRNQGELVNPPRYAWQGKTWSGAGGPKPKWVIEALGAGVTLAQMELECKRMRDAGEITHPAWQQQQQQPAA